MTPKRIVSIYGSGGETRFEFHQDVFESILKSVGREVVVVSTLGSQRIGKTFLLNFVLRYLTAPVPATWLLHKNSEESLEGFPWSENDPIENRGIWLMADPVCLISSWGQTVQVLVMDTKGTGTDTITIAKEMELFSEICHQLSSCTLFNVANEISSKDFEILTANRFSEPGPSKIKPKGIPHLIYCVRDWDPANGFRPDASRAFLYLSKITESLSLSKRTSIQSRWSNSSCALLPFPGEMTQWRRYNGNIASLDGHFVRSLEEFIPATFDPDCLAVLAHDREQVLSRFSTLSQAFKAKETNVGRSESFQAGAQSITKRMNLLSISNDSLNYMHFKIALEHYKGELDRKQIKSEAELLIVHQALKKDAITCFVNSDLKGNFKYIRDEEEGLARDIEEIYKMFLYDWRKTQDKYRGQLEAAYQQSIALYLEKIDEFCSKPGQSEARLQRFHKTCLQEAEEEFETEVVHLPADLVQSYSRKIFQEIQSKLLLYKSTLEEKNRQRKVTNIDFAETLAIKVYKDELDSKFMARSFFESEVLEIYHSLAYRMAMKEFQKNVDFDEFDATQGLQDSASKMFETYKKQNAETKLRVEEKLNQASMSVLAQFTQNLEPYERRDGVTIEEFDTANMHWASSAKLRFFSYEDTENECVIKETWTKLELKMAGISTRIKQGVGEIVSARLAGWRQESSELVQSLLSDFKEEMNKETLRAHDITKLKRHFEDRKAEIIETYNTRTDGIEKNIKEEYLGRLITSLGSELMDEITERAKLRIEASRLRLKEAKLEASKHYEEEMKKKFPLKTTFYKPADLLGIHLKILKIIKAKFGTDLFPEQLRELEESLDPALQTFQRKNDVNTPSKKTAIGIDLGTTYSCVALYHAGEVEVLRDEHGKFTIPSYVALIDGVEVIGQEAKAQAYLHPQDTVYDAKRMLAKDFADPCLQADMKHWSFEVVDQDGSARIKLKHGTQLLPPERISSKILSTLKKLAEKYLKTEVQDAVITVPAYFKDGQRNATKDAGELAGLNVLSIINEPTAAALAYFWENIHEGPVNVLVYDLGGGTFDVSVLAMENGVVEVLAVGGDGHLGGEDFDNNVIEYCVQEFKKKTGLDLMAEKMSPDLAKREKHRSIMRRLKNIVEDAKISLAFTPSKNILLEAIHTSHDLNVPLTREMFNFLNQKALDKTLRIVKQTLKESGLKKEQIDEVVLIGGSSRIIKVKEMLGEYFERDLTHSVNPDEAVAVGAAIQAAILNGNKEQRLQNISLEDVTPLSLGIGYRADIYSVIIPKNTKVPVSQSETYHKTPLQRSIYIPVYEGEERKASDNHYLGTYSISDLPITEEDLEIQVTLSISKENILSVSATGEGISKKFVVKRKGRMSTEEKRKYLQEDLEGSVSGFAQTSEEKPGSSSSTMLKPLRSQWSNILKNKR